MEVFAGPMICVNGINDGEGANKHISPCACQPLGGHKQLIVELLSTVLTTN